MELIVRTGFQSSLRMFKQTLPSRSILGWYTFVSHLTWKIVLFHFQLLWVQWAYLRGLMRVGSSNLEAECELTMSIKALNYSNCLYYNCRYHILPHQGRSQVWSLGGHLGQGTQSCTFWGVPVHLYPKEVNKFKSQETLSETLLL